MRAEERAARENQPLHTYVNRRSKQGMMRYEEFRRRLKENPKKQVQTFSGLTVEQRIALERESLRKKKKESGGGGVWWKKIKNGR